MWYSTTSFLQRFGRVPLAVEGIGKLFNISLCRASPPRVSCLVCPMWSCLHTPHHVQRSWDEALSKSKDASASLVRDRETRLRNAIQELETTRNDLREARDGATATAAALMQEREDLSASRARTKELHKLGVDMERELTAMLKGGLLLPLLLLLLLLQLA